MGIGGRMSEIEKLYENAGVGYLMYVVDTFPPVEYPQIDFTAEKQIELIKWLIFLCKNGEGIKDSYISMEIINNAYRFYLINPNWVNSLHRVFSINENFEEMLAGFINNLWQDLTEKEKEQIKEILSE